MRALELPVDVFYNDEGYRLVGDLPGVEPEAVEVTVEDGTLRVRNTSDEADLRERAFRLPRGLDASRVSARLEQGVLTIDLPRTPETRRRSIPVAAG